MMVVRIAQRMEVAPRVDRVKCAKTTNGTVWLRGVKTTNALART
jgi:hypothetical protein